MLGLFFIALKSRMDSFFNITFSTSNPPDAGSVILALFSNTTSFTLIRLALSIKADSATLTFTFPLWLERSNPARLLSPYRITSTLPSNMPFTPPVYNT